MWEQYKKTLIGMQIVIFAVTAGIYSKFGQQITVALAFFVTMQLSAVLGAMWAARLKGRLERRADTLPLRPKA